jgi:DNA-binding NarL/FixJ family response regulator
MSVKVAIVEDNVGVRENWVKLLNGEPGFKCVAACGSGEDAITTFPGCSPDVALMDINLPGMSGIECTARLKQLLPKLQILMVTVYADNEHVFEALKMGASGYLLKSADPAELTRSIREVVKGGAPMSGQIARRVIEVFRQPAAAAAAASARAELSAREEEVLALLAKGYANKEIAARLGGSVETIRVHIRHIYEKLHVHSRTEAVALYFTDRKLAAAQLAR